MRIVVLDADPAFGSNYGQPTTPIGHIKHPRLESLGELMVYQTTTREETVARLSEADVALSNKAPLGEAEFLKLPKLKLVSVLATGVNVIDLKAASAHGVTVCNVPGYSTASTAQHTIALLLELCNRVGKHSASVSEGKWAAAQAFSYFHSPTIELDGKTLGIIGYGAIGSRVAQIASALGMRVLVHTRTPRQSSEVEYVELSDLLGRSDVISLHLPLTENTHHLINGESIAQMKDGAILINVARGPIVDEKALALALDQGKLAFAGLDVLSDEPPPANNPLMTHPLCVVTPHIAWASQAARKRLLDVTADNIEAFFRGTPQNTVTS